ncbi:MAG: hypothetical protein GKC53_03620 [Neisseriaceae bacterium]|nr:MAG: hypothetical protein GKC53_03620 [Neisseriaceae bacterium]
MSSDQRQYCQMEADILRTKLEVNYVKDKQMGQRRPKGVSQRLMSYVPTFGGLTKVIFTNKAIISRLIRWVFFLFLSRKVRLVSKINNKVVSILIKKIKNKWRNLL